MRNSQQGQTLQVSGWRLCKVGFEVAEKSGIVFLVFINDSFVYAAIVDMIVATGYIFFDAIFTGHLELSILLNYPAGSDPAGGRRSTVK